MGIYELVIVRGQRSLRLEVTRRPNPVEKVECAPFVQAPLIGWLADWHLSDLNSRDRTLEMLILLISQPPIEIIREPAEMLAPMHLKQQSKMPMGVIRAKFVKSPQNFLQIVGDVQNVVDCIADDDLAQYVYPEDCAVMAKIRKPCPDFRMCCTDFRRLIVTFAWFPEWSAMVAEGQLVHAPCKRCHGWGGTESGEVNEALRGGNVCRNHVPFTTRN